MHSVIDQSGDEEDAFGATAARLGFQLHWTDVDAMARLSARLVPLAITPARATATIYVARHEGCDQVALGRALGINRASTMKAVDELVALGVVERRPGRDRRSNALHLTEAGHRLCSRIERVMADHDADYFSGLTDDERSTLATLLARLRERPVAAASTERLSA